MTTKTQKTASRIPNKTAKKSARNPRQGAYFKTLATYCETLDLKNNSATRHDATHQALGHSKSSKDFDDIDWDLALGFLRWRIEGASGEWGPAQRTIIEIEGKRRRLIYRIRQEKDQPYIEAIAKDKCGSTDLDNLSLKDLEDLRLTMIERARTAKRKAARGELDLGINENTYGQGQ